MLAFLKTLYRPILFKFGEAVKKNIAFADRTANHHPRTRPPHICGNEKVGVFCAVFSTVLGVGRRCNKHLLFSRNGYDRKKLDVFYALPNAPGSISRQRIWKSIDKFDEVSRFMKMLFRAGLNRFQ